MKIFKKIFLFSFFFLKIFINDCSSNHTSWCDYDNFCSIAIAYSLNKKIYKFFNECNKKSDNKNYEECIQQEIQKMNNSNEKNIEIEQQIKNLKQENQNLKQENQKRNNYINMFYIIIEQQKLKNNNNILDIIKEKNLKEFLDIIKKENFKEFLNIKEENFKEFLNIKEENFKESLNIKEENFKESLEKEFKENKNKLTNKIKEYLLWIERGKKLLEGLPINTFYALKHKEALDHIEDGYNTLKNLKNNIINDTIDSNYFISESELIKEFLKVKSEEKKAIMFLHIFFNKNNILNLKNIFILSAISGSVAGLYFLYKYFKSKKHKINPKKKV